MAAKARRGRVTLAVEVTALAVAVAFTAVALAVGLGATGATAHEPPAGSGGVAPVDTWPSRSPRPGSPAGPQTVASVKSGVWSRRPVTVELSCPGRKTSQTTTFWRLDAGDWTEGRRLEIGAPDDHANDGRHLVEFYSIDRDLTIGPPGAVEVNIDTRPPVLTWRDVRPHTAGDRRRVWASLTGTDACPRLRVSYVLRNAWGYRVARRGGMSRDSGAFSVPVALRYAAGGRLLPGLYRISVRVSDLAGNTAAVGARPFRVHRPVTAGVWRRVNGAGDRVALTFDDGRSPQAWASILSTLDAYDVKATFFACGVHVAGNPGLARRTLAGGHAIGSHTYLHPNLAAAGPKRAYDEVVRDRGVWWNVAKGSPLPYFRPPMGAYDAATVRAVGQAGYARVILWDVDPSDWRSPPADVIVSRVLKGARGGSIILLHLQPNTARALPAIIRGLRQKGLRPVTLPTLYRAAGLRT